MLISKLQGGLGNQLFEYAAATMFSRQLHTQLVMESSYYLLVRNRSFVLNELGLDIKTSVLPLLFPLNIMQLETFWTGVAKRFSFYGLSLVSEQSQFSFQPRLHLKGKNVFLQGYWQHRKYADEAGSDLRSKLIARRSSCAAIALGLTDIEQTESVGIHIRRTDYVTSKAFEPCSVEYYQQAIDLCTKKLNKIVFYVCTDNPAWVISHLDLPKNTIFISGNNYLDWHEFLLLSACKHLIMANSTFSWWAAWVGGITNRIVIAPKTWSVNHSVASKALIYPEWIQL